MSSASSATEGEGVGWWGCWRGRTAGPLSGVPPRIASSVSTISLSHTHTLHTLLKHTHTDTHYALGRPSFYLRIHLCFLSHKTNAYRIMACPLTRTADGFESQLQVNCASFIHTPT